MTPHVDQPFADPAERSPKAPDARPVRAKRTAAERMRAAQQSLERAKAAVARSAEVARKYETRRKIVAGGLLLAMAQKDARYAALARDLIALVDERDRGLFDDVKWASNGVG